MKKKPKPTNPSCRLDINFEVRCQACGSMELWGLERAVRGMVKTGKLSAESQFDAELFAALFLVHAGSLPCPQCRELGALIAFRAAKNDWNWDDAVRCEDCNQEIPAERLQAVPGTTRCLKCQQIVDAAG